MTMLLLSVALVIAVKAILNCGVREGQRLIYQIHVGGALVIEALERSVARPFHLLNNVTLRVAGSAGRTTPPEPSNLMIILGRLVGPGLPPASLCDGLPTQHPPVIGTYLQEQHEPRTEFLGAVTLFIDRVPALQVTRPNKAA